METVSQIIAMQNAFNIHWKTNEIPDWLESDDKLTNAVNCKRKATYSKMESESDIDLNIDLLHPL